MSTAYHALSFGEVFLAASLIVVNGLISVLLRLDLGQRLLIASVRAVTQLLLIGLVLKWVFEDAGWPVIVLLMAMMTLIAGVSAVRRVERRYPGIWISSIIAVTTSSWIVTGVALTAVISPDVWSQNKAQYAIPLLGMILGNTLTGISLGLGRLSEQLVANRGQVELLLTLGATRWEAAQISVQQAVRTGMIPILNSMMVMGLVSLPGMMTGQLLAGVAPLDAVKYQIVIVFLIAAGTALGTILAVVLSYRRLFNGRHQFLYESITKAG